MELEDETYMPVAKFRQFRIAGADHVFTEHDMAARRGPHECAEDGEKRALARARGTEQRDEVAFRQGHVQAAQNRCRGLPLAERLDQIPDLDQRAHWPITWTGSTPAAALAGRMEATMAPMVVSSIARP